MSRTDDAALATLVAPEQPAAPADPGPRSPRRRPPATRALAWAALLFGVLYFALPLWAMGEFSLRMRRDVYSLDAYAAVLSSADFQRTFVFSLVMSLLTIVVGVLVVVPTAYWVRLRMPWLRPLVEFVTLLPLVIPAIVIVYGFVRMFNTGSWLPLTGSAGGANLLLLMGYTVLALPYMYRAVDAGLASLDVRTLTEAAQSLGAGWGAIVGRVILPNVMPAVLSGAFLTFAIVIGEFTFTALLDRPGFGPYMQRLGEDRAYLPQALAVIAFALTWACIGLLQLVTRTQRHMRVAP
jgi:putative spermidine/putrescine transport system permease protein